MVKVVVEVLVQLLRVQELLHILLLDLLGALLCQASQGELARVDFPFDVELQALLVEVMIAASEEEYVLCVEILEADLANEILISFFPAFALFPLISLQLQLILSLQALD